MRFAGNWIVPGQWTGRGFECMPQTFPSLAWWHSLGTIVWIKKLLWSNVHQSRVSVAEVMPPTTYKIARRTSRAPLQHAGRALS